MQSIGLRIIVHQPFEVELEKRLATSELQKTTSEDMLHARLGRCDLFGKKEGQKILSKISNDCHMYLLREKYVFINLK